MTDNQLICTGSIPAQMVCLHVIPVVNILHKKISKALAPRDLAEIDQLSIEKEKMDKDDDILQKNYYHINVSCPYKK